MTRAQDSSARGDANGYKNAVTFERGHHVKYDNPYGVATPRRTRHPCCGHEAVFSAAPGSFSAASHDSSFAELDHLRECLGAQYLHADASTE